MYHDALSKEELKVLSHPSSCESKPQPAAEANGPLTINECHGFTELHNEFSTTLMEVFGKLGACDVRCRLRDAIRGTYGQFVFSQTIPTCCAVIRAEPIHTEFFLAIQPSILYPLLDSMCGTTSKEPPPQRPMTEIEAVLAKRMMRQILHSYSQTFERALSLELVIDRLQHNAQQLKGLSGGEPVFHVTYDVICGSDYGRVTICLPWLGTQQIREQLAATTTNANRPAMA